MISEYQVALDAANYFRTIGLVPLPSKMTGRKQPMIDFKEYRTSPVPSHVYSVREWQTTNIQIMTGVETRGATKIVVIDLDGPEAIDAWHETVQKNRTNDRSAPWIALTGSAGGMHIYWRLPEAVTVCPTRLIWGLWDTLPGRGWVKHKEIRLLGDRGLVVAPPSVRIDGAGSYTWDKRHNPVSIPLPGYAPAWLLAFPGVIVPERQYHDDPKPEYKQNSHGGLRQKVLDAIPPKDKVALAKQWGLRFAEANPRISATWMPCRSINRVDETPSAGFNPSTGVYNEPSSGGAEKGVSFYDLAVRLGVFRSWSEAMEFLAEKYLR